jgi:hypothetical protein
MVITSKGETMKARLITFLVVACIALGAASAAHAEAITLSTAGAPGPWMGADAFGEVYCEAPDQYSTNSNRWFQVQRLRVGRSPLYATKAHDVFMQVRLEWSRANDGANWFLFQSKPWQKRTVAAGFSSAYALFEQETFNVSAYAGYLWRTRVEFRWYVAGTSTYLGTAIDTFTAPGILRQHGAIRYVLNATGEGVCFLP